MASPLSLGLPPHPCNLAPSPCPPLACLALPCPSLLAFGSYPTVSPSVPTFTWGFLFLSCHFLFVSILVSLYFYRSGSWFLSILSFLVPLFCLVRFLLFRVAFSTCPSMALSLPTLPYPLFSLFHSLSTFLCPIVLFLSFHAPFSPYLIFISLFSFFLNTYLSFFYLHLPLFSLLSSLFSVSLFFFPSPISCSLSSSSFSPPPHGSLKVLLLLFVRTSRSHLRTTSLAASEARRTSGLRVE